MLLQQWLEDMLKQVFEFSAGPKIKIKPEYTGECFFSYWWVREETLAPKPNLLNKDVCKCVGSFTALGLPQPSP